MKEVTRSADLLVRNSEWGGYTVKKSAKGFIVELWSRRQGELTDRKYLARYDEVFPKDTDLSAPWNEGMTKGDAVVYGVNAPDERTRTRSMVLRKGHIVQ